MGIIKFSTVDEMGIDQMGVGQVGSYLFQQDSAVYDLDFRSNWPEFSKKAIFFLVQLQ